MVRFLISFQVHFIVLLKRRQTRLSIKKSVKVTKNVNKFYFEKWMLIFKINERSVFFVFFSGKSIKICSCSIFFLAA